MEEEKSDFNFKEFEEQAIKRLKQGQTLEGKDGVLAPLIKRLVEAGLNGEMDVHLHGASKVNRRNGKTGKQVKTSFGNVEIETPRDRNGSFEPQLLPKRQTTLGDGLDHKVIALYGLGMSYKDICNHLEELYGLTVSPATLSTITDKIIEEVKVWQNRPLESVYPFMWLDAIHYKVKEDGAIKTKAVYCLLGVNREGVKDLLGLYISENEGARFWLNVLADIQNRGVKDILIACIDNLKGFARLKFQTNSDERGPTWSEIRPCTAAETRLDRRADDHRSSPPHFPTKTPYDFIKSAFQAIKTVLP
jgi:transposase-like protein